MVNLGFWNKVHVKAAAVGRPILVLAPMADVTDAAFRRIIAARGKPDVTWTEFVSADGLARADERGKGKLMRDLLFTDAERPIVAQFFTATPEYMRQAAELAVRLGFDGIDINMGCPDRGIERQGAGAALIKTPKLARELIRAAKEGAKNGTGSLPVSVKTRTGWSVDQLETWLPELLAEEPAVITVHARTRKELSKVPARWQEVRRAVEIRDRVQGAGHSNLPKGERTLIFGNGDVRDSADALAKAGETGADGVMLGRAIFGNPWLFSGRDAHDFTIPGAIASISIRERLETLAEHTKLFAELLGDIKNFAIMKKHFKAYVTGWDGAAELRAKLMEANSAEEVRVVIAHYLDTI
jgi:nifR3 family TIM-barrel protein